MKHRFYEKPETDQKQILIKTGVLLFLVTGLIIALALYLQLYLLIWLVPVLFLVATPFIDLPMGRKSGKFIYHSPLFITEKTRNDNVTVHGGTLFDYFYTIEKSMTPNERKKFVLYGYIIGLIAFLKEKEDSAEQDLTICGTSYILNERTAERFGFKTVQTDALQYMLLLVNYIPITISNSLIKKRLHFPNFSEIKTYEAKLSEITKKCPHLWNWKIGFDLGIEED